MYRYWDLIGTLGANRDVSWTYLVFRYTTCVKTHHPDCFPPGMNKIQGEIQVQKPLKRLKIQNFKIHVNGLKILKSKKSCLLLLCRSKHDFLDLLRSRYKFWRYIQFFKVNLKILCLITRKILGQNLNKYDTELFYVILDWISSEYRWPELNTGQQCICDDFL